MSMSDPIADMLSRIRNAQKAKILVIEFPHSKIKENICKVLLNEGYIKSIETLDIEGKKNLQVELKYSISGEPVIKSIDRVSKPGKRVYQSMQDMKDYYNGFGRLIISTSKGVMSDIDAKKHRVGGEIKCKIF